MQLTDMNPEYADTPNKAGVVDLLSGSFGFCSLTSPRIIGKIL
jgi:hypothetical protein